MKAFWFAAKLFSVTAFIFLTPVRGDMIIYQAAGTREQIQPTIDRFKHDIVYGPGQGEGSPPPFPGSYKVATFDDVAGSSTAILSAFSSGGVLFASMPEEISLVSANVPANDPTGLFGDIDPDASHRLQSFSGRSVFGVAAPLPVDFVLVVPHMSGPANAVGGVFIHGGAGESIGFDLSTISGDATSPSSLIPVLPTPVGADFSFLGVITEPGSRVSGLGIRLGAFGVGPGFSPIADSSRSVVALDDLIWGMAPPLPEPSITLMALLAAPVLFAVNRSRRPGRRRQ